MAFFQFHMKWAFLGVLVSCMVLSGCRKNEIVYLETLTEREGPDESSGHTGKDAALQTEAEGTPEETIAVFVCGAVNRPGVYMLPVYARANDAVEAAGGFRDDADTQWCNLAEHLFDGQRLRIYTAEETLHLKEEGVNEEGAPGKDADGAENAPDTASGKDAQGRIDLNTATKEELMTLPGIGEARAEAILSWRREHGSFTDTEQIKQISGFKDVIYNSIRALVTVG